MIASALYPAATAALNTYHFAMNPASGGKPPRDSRKTAIKPAITNIKPQHIAAGGPRRDSKNLSEIKPLMNAPRMPKKQSRQLRDAYLPGAAVALTRLAGLADQGEKTGDDDYDAFDIKEPGDDLPGAGAAGLRRRPASG